MPYGPVILLVFVSLSVRAMAGEPGIVVAHPDWSPDDGQLAFEANWDGARNIFIMNADGSHVRQLTFGEAMDTYPRFSPDGEWLVFLSHREPQFSMHLIRPDGTNERALLPADGNLEPAFSPDSRRVAFRTYLGGGDRDGEIMIADTTGKNAQRLTDNDVEDGFPVFSADGRRLFFHRRIGEFAQIMTLDLASGDEIQLTRGNFTSWHAHASADGRRIVYDSDQAGNRDIYSMDLETGQVMQLTFDPGRDDYPKFSNDGRHIAFHSDRSGTTGIYTMNADGTGQARIVPQWPE